MPTDTPGDAPLDMLRARFRADYDQEDAEFQEWANGSGRLELVDFWDRCNDAYGEGDAKVRRVINDMTPHQRDILIRLARRGAEEAIHLNLYGTKPLAAAEESQ